MNQTHEPKPLIPPTSPQRELGRADGLRAALAVIRRLRGYRKNPDYRMTQNDLNFICEALQRASVGRLFDGEWDGDDGVGR